MATRRTCGVVCGVVLMLTCVEPRGVGPIRQLPRRHRHRFDRRARSGRLGHDPQRSDRRDTDRDDDRSRLLPIHGAARRNLHRSRHARRIQDRRAGAHRPAFGRDADGQRHPRVRSGGRRGDRLWRTPLIETSQGRVSGLIESRRSKPAAHGPQLLQPRRADARRDRARHRRRRRRTRSPTPTSTTTSSA